MGGFLLFEQLFKDRQNLAPKKNKPMNSMNGDEGCDINWMGGGPQCMYLDSKNHYKVHVHDHMVSWTFAMSQIVTLSLILVPQHR